MTENPSRLAILAHWIGVENSPVSHGERLLSGLGGFVAMLAITACNHALGGATHPVLIGSMGASAVLLFAAPHGALSQPWPVFGGQLLSAAIGVSCHALVSDPLLAGPLAVALAIVAMHYLRCLHPPGGATALVAVIGGDAIHQLGYGYLLYPVGLQVSMLLAAALLFNAPLKWRRYPVAWARRLQQPAHYLALQHEDLAAALKEIDSFIDVDEDDLKLIFSLADKHARARRAAQRWRGNRRAPVTAPNDSAPP